MINPSLMIYPDSIFDATEQAFENEVLVKKVKELYTQLCNAQQNEFVRLRELIDIQRELEALRPLISDADKKKMVKRFQSKDQPFINAENFVKTYKPMKEWAAFQEEYGEVDASADAFINGAYLYMTEPETWDTSAMTPQAQKAVNSFKKWLEQQG